MDWSRPPTAISNSANQGGSIGSVSEFSIDASTGALTMVNFYPNWVQPTEAPGWIAFDLSGHAFVGNPQEISQFTVDASTGALTGNGTTTTPNLSSYGAVDPSGRFLYTADIYYTVSQYTIDSAGTLTPNGTFALAPNLQANVLAFAQR